MNGVHMMKKCCVFWW